MAGFQVTTEDGVQAASELLRFSPAAVVLTDSLYEVPVLIIELKEVGVKAFVSKERIAIDFDTCNLNRTARWSVL
jgi:hypothetical protein